MLAAPVKRWEPPIPLADVSEKQIAKAVQLREALRPLLACQHDCSLSEGDFAELGVKHYAQVFGYAISARYWRDLWKRTLQRAGAMENFESVELYLDESAFVRASAPAPVSSATAETHESLAEMLQHLKNPANPTEEDRVFLFDAAFRHLEQLAAESPGKLSALKRDVQQFLYDSAPRARQKPRSLSPSL